MILFHSISHTLPFPLPLSFLLHPSLDLIVDRARVFTEISILLSYARTHARTHARFEIMLRLMENKSKQGDLADTYANARKDRSYIDPWEYLSL